MKIPFTEKVPCELCGAPTYMTGTKRCDFCGELEQLIQANPSLAKKILEKLENAPPT